MRIIKTTVEKAGIPKEKDQVFYRDEKLKGFALRVTRVGIKSFIVEKRINGKVKRITLGRYGELTVEQARKEAQKLLGKIATGGNPIAEKKGEQVHRITLSEVFCDYLKARIDLKPKSIYDYTRIIENVFSDWKKKPLLSFKKDKISAYHAKLGEESGQYYANYAMRVLRALFNFAKAKYEDSDGNSFITENPVTRLSATRSWFRTKRRKRYIKNHQLYDWYNATMNLGSENVRDYLIFVVLTGLRKNEAAQLKWSNIDLKDRALILPDPKNRHEHKLPLSTHACAILHRRKQSSSSEYIFPGSGKSGYLIEPRKQMNRVAKAIDMHFTLHDLRRTFTTVAESLDISRYALKRLLNHWSDDDDVTAGYIGEDVERLRAPMQLINDTIMLRCNSIESYPIALEKKPEIA
jgi:integrase